MRYSTKTSRVNRIATFCGALALAISGTPPLAARSAENWTVVMPYVAKGTGIGGGPNLGAIVIRSGTQESVASRALLAVLQQAGLRVIRPTIGLDGAVPPRTAWRTDIAPMTGAVIADYNRARAALPLPPAIYGVRYEGMFDCQNGRFRYRIGAQLFQRSRLTGWSRVGDDRYYGNFFVDLLTHGVTEALSREAAR